MNTSHAIKLNETTAAFVQRQGTRPPQTIVSLRNILRRRRAAFITVSAVIMAMCTIAILMMEPRYQAESRLQIDPTRDPTLNSGNANPTDLGFEAIDTEITLITSDALAQKVAIKLKLHNDAEFNPALTNSKAAQLSPEQQVSLLTQAVKDNLTVRRDRQAYILNIGFTSHDAQKSSAIANAFAETYITEKLANQTRNAEQQSEFYRQRLNAMAQSVRDADAAVALFKAQAGIVEGASNGTIVDQQVAPLSTQLAMAQSQAAEARAALLAARAQVSRGGMEAVSAVRGSPVIADLRRQRAEVIRNRGEIDTRYGERHPESIKVHEQLAALDWQIQEEAQRALGSLEADAKAAEARVGSLQMTMQDMESRQADNTHAAATASMLEREAQSQRAAYDRLADLAQRSEQNASNTIARAAIIDRAATPPAASSPNRPILLALALVAALSLGAAFALVMEWLTPGFTSIADFEARMGLPIIAALPQVKAISPSDLVLYQPSSAYAEAMRIARVSLARLHPAPTTLAITSALPHEGKTSTSMALARLFAANAERVLLIDCDTRRAGLSQTLPARAKSHCLIDVMRTTARLEDAIVPDHAEGVDILPLSQTSTAHEDLITRHMAAFLANASASYDRIILDLPPLNGLADGQAIAPLVDATVLVVRWGATPIQAVAVAVSTLKTNGANPVGALFAMTDPASEAMGGLNYTQNYA